MYNVYCSDFLQRMHRLGRNGEEKLRGLENGVKQVVYHSPSIRPRAYSTVTKLVFLIICSAEKNPSNFC